MSAQAAVAVHPAAPGWRTLLAPGLATLVAFAILVGLGTWQLQRKAWKEALIARIDARAHADPPGVPPAPSAWNPERDEYRRVAITGTFLNDRETLVHGLAAGDAPGRALQGYFVVTPLRTVSGATVLIDRGIVPTELKDFATRPASRPSGLVTVTGMLRSAQARSLFVPDNDTARETWFTKDIGAIAAARGLGPVAPYLIEADATPNPGGWPRGGGVLVDLPNNHLQYAFTWFGIALCLVGVFGVFAYRRLHPASGEAAHA